MYDYMRTIINFIFIYYFISNADDTIVMYTDLQNT